MEYYKSFNAEALELSKSLPEEQSELYKRHFVKLQVEDFERKMDGDGGPAEEKELASLAERITSGLKIKFDVIIGPTKHIINKTDDASIKVVKIGDLTEEHLKGKIYKSRDDKHVAFVHAHTKRFVFIDVQNAATANLNVLFANTELPMTTQVLVNTGNESSLELFEWYASTANTKSLSGALHEVTIGKYAKAEINMLHNENENTSVINFTKGRVKENGNLKVNYIYNGGAVTRVKNEISAVGFAAKSEIVEIVMGSGNQKFDISTIIANVDQNTVSDLESKAALMDSATCFLKGFANVGESAKGSLSFVNERGILLDRTAYMNSIPGMSINNADVKATHSSATAPVEEDSLFYLMSRGADEKVARRLLVTGFFSGSIAKINSPIVKAVVSSLMHDKISTKQYGHIPKLDLSDVWIDHVQNTDMFMGHYKYRELK